MKFVTFYSTLNQVNIVSFDYNNMLNIAKLRLMSDLKVIMEQPADGVSASPIDEKNIMSWCATIFGPDETSWEGGIFSLHMQFSAEYPVSPPVVKFTCPMFHPNIYSDGNLCLDLIAENWSPIYSVNSILVAIRSLLTDPNCNSPANPEAADIYLKDRKLYERRVRNLIAQTSSP